MGSTYADLVAENQVIQGLRKFTIEPPLVGANGIPFVGAHGIRPP
jgi:hypothetical protein